MTALKNWLWRHGFEVAYLILGGLLLLGGWRLAAQVMAAEDASERLRAAVEAMRWDRDLECRAALMDCRIDKSELREGWRSVRVDASVCGRRATWIHWGPMGPQVSCDADVVEVRQ